MLIIDDKGDAAHSEPHIFVDFSESGPFTYVTGNLIHGHGQVVHGSELNQKSRKSIFPTEFPAPKKPSIRDVVSLSLANELVQQLQRLSGAGTLYVFNDRLKGLSVGDVIKTPPRDGRTSEAHADITRIEKTTVAALLKQHGNDAGYWRHRFKESASREVKDSERVIVVEVFSVMLPFQGDHLVYLDDNRF
jgi:hypothetical protein